MTSGELASRHPKVQRLRALHRDRQARASEHAFVLEGPRLVEAALDRGATLEAVYLGHRARAAFGSLLTRLDRAGVPVHELREGVLEKLGATRTPQPVLAVTPIVAGSLQALDTPGDVARRGRRRRPRQPGDHAAQRGGRRRHHRARHRRVGRRLQPQGGAILGRRPARLTVVECRDASDALDASRRSGRRVVGTAAHGGQPVETLDPATPIALVVGNEARGVAPALQDRLDTVVTIPMHGPAESLNVAMAATILLFERDRHRSGRRPSDAGAST